MGQQRLNLAVAGLDQTLTRRPGRQELQEDLRQPAVLLLLAVNLGVYLVYSTVFYFMKNFAGHLGGGEVGTFFTLSTVTLILAPMAIESIGVASGTTKL